MGGGPWARATAARRHRASLSSRVVLLPKKNHLLDWEQHTLPVDRYHVTPKLQYGGALLGPRFSVVLAHSPE